MQSSYALFEEQLTIACNQYRQLKIKERNGEKYLWGTIDVHDVDGNLIQSFFIEIHCGDKFPYGFPQLYEIGGYIPRSIDWHKYSDDLCCVTVDPIEIIICKNGITLCSFIENHVIPYLANQYYRKEFGAYKAEYAHGSVGLFQAYCDIMKTSDTSLWKRYILCALGAYKVNLSRNANCFCDSGKKYKHCHMIVFQNLKCIGKKNLLNHMQILNIK